MNWLNQKKKFTYFYNEFRPVNRMVLYKMWCKWFFTHIILVAVEGLWHLELLFYHNTHYSQRR